MVVSRKQEEKRTEKDGDRVLGVYRQEKAIAHAQGYSGWRGRANGQNIVHEDRKVRAGLLIR